MAITKFSVPLSEGLGYYIEGGTVPQNTSLASTNALETGRTNGQLEVTVRAASAVALADTTTFSVNVTTSGSEGGTYVAVGSSTFTADGATTFNTGDVVTSFVLPTNETLDNWTKADIATTDAAATGTVDVFIRYIVS